MRVWAVNGHELGAGAARAREVEALLGQHDDRAALGRLVGQARELGGLGQLRARSTPAAGRKAAAWRLPKVMVPVLSSSSVEHVAGRLDRPARHGQHVALHEAVHAGDADGRQQRADGGRDEADQQGDEHDDLLLGAACRWRRAAG